MLPLEHSAILLTCIKRQLVLKTILVFFLSGRLRQVLLNLFCGTVYTAFSSLTIAKGNCLGQFRKILELWRTLPNVTIASLWKIKLIAFFLSCGGLCLSMFCVSGLDLWSVIVAIPSLVIPTCLMKPQYNDISWSDCYHFRPMLHG